MCKLALWCLCNWAIRYSVYSQIGMIQVSFRQNVSKTIGSQNPYKHRHRHEWLCWPTILQQTIYHRRLGDRKDFDSKSLQSPSSALLLYKNLLCSSRKFPIFPFALKAPSNDGIRCHRSMPRAAARHQWPQSGVWINRCLLSSKKGTCRLQYICSGRIRFDSLWREP